MIREGYFDIIMRVRGIEGWYSVISRGNWSKAVGGSSSEDYLDVMEVLVGFRIFVID